MNEIEQLNHDLPSGKSLLISTAIAMAVASVILVTIILPTEYDIDPTGIGNMLGLTVISSSVASIKNTDIKSPNTTIKTDVDKNPPPLIAPDPLAPPSVSPDSYKYITSRDTLYKTEIIEIAAQGDDEFEYKFKMKKGEVLLYSWNSGGAEMYYEFHAEPTEGEYPEGYYMSYEIGEDSSSGKGSLVAPFTGNHGWYFINLTEYPVTITLEVSGYYESHSRLM